MVFNIMYLYIYTNIIYYYSYSIIIGRYIIRNNMLAYIYIKYTNSCQKKNVVEVHNTECSNSNCISIYFSIIRKDTSSFFNKIVLLLKTNQLLSTKPGTVQAEGII